MGHLFGRPQPPPPPTPRRPYNTLSGLKHWLENTDEKGDAYALINRFVFCLPKTEVEEHTHTFHIAGPNYMGADGGNRSMYYQRFDNFLDYLNLEVVSDLVDFTESGTRDYTASVCETHTVTFKLGKAFYRG